MRSIPVVHLKENQILAESLLDTNFNILLKIDTQLSSEKITQLTKYGYRTLYIKDKYDEVFDPIISPQRRVRLLKHIKDTFILFKEIHKQRHAHNSNAMKRLFKERDVMIDGLIEFTNETLLDLKKQNIKRLETVDIKSEQLYPYQHALSTAIISSIIGIRLGLNFLELKTLFISSIFIEMGNLSIPDKILYKKGRLNQEEFEILKGHTNISYQEVKSCSELNRFVKLVCLEHHEKLDGSGYPNGLKSSNIDHLTRIVTIADSYDALTSDRTYRPAYSPQKALEVMRQGLGISYDPKYFNILEDIIVPYPKGTLLSLNIGVARVVNYSDHPHKPIVQDLDTMKLIDLNNIRGVKIVGLNYKA